MDFETENVIIGAGPAGLAMAGRLRRRGRDFIVLEQWERVAEAWHTHYDRLHLHTVKETSHLPYKPFPTYFPRYVPRQMLVDYYAEYQREMGIEPHFGQQVTAVKRAADGRWRTTTAQGNVYLSQNVIVCTGFNRIPHIPSWPGSERFTGKMMHSKSYRSGADFAGQAVLVVGMGNTGAEIALDLWEQGARPSISVRGPVNVVPRDVLGRPTQQTAMLLSKLPNAIGDGLGVLLRKLTVGDLSAYGLETPALPPAAQLREFGKTPVIDIGTIAQIKAGNIKVRPAIERFKGDEIIFADGERARFDAVILATGFHSQIEAFVEDGASLLDAHGHPAAAVSARPGLYFLGFDGYSTGGLLLSILRDSEIIAAHIDGA